MNRIQLVQTIADAHTLSKAEAARVLNTVLDTIVGAVKKGDSVSLLGFGTFKLAARAARTGRNPATGATIRVPAAKLPKFAAGTAFKAAVDSKFAARHAEKTSAKPKAKAKKAVLKKPMVKKLVAKPVLRKAA